DQISKPFSGCQKFTDDDTDKAETNVYLHVADNGRYGRRQHDFGKGMQGCTMEGVDQLEFIFIRPCKAGVKCHNASKDSHRHSGHNNCCPVCAKPYNEKRCKSRLWKTV